MGDVLPGTVQSLVAEVGAIIGAAVATSKFCLANVVSAGTADAATAVVSVAL